MRETESHILFLSAQSTLLRIPPKIEDKPEDNWQRATVIIEAMAKDWSRHFLRPSYNDGMEVHRTNYIPFGQKEYQWVIERTNTPDHFLLRSLKWNDNTHFVGYIKSSFDFDAFMNMYSKVEVREADPVEIKLDPNF